VGAKAKSFRAECDPERVVIELDKLWREFLDRYAGEPLDTWSAHAELARWTAGWHGRFRVQWSRLGEWARATDQPRAAQRAIFAAEHDESTKELKAEADAVRYEREAAKLACRSTGRSAAQAVA
jgi:hypothetical protein